MVQAGKVSAQQQQQQQQLRGRETRCLSLSFLGKGGLDRLNCKQITQLCLSSLYVDIKQLKIQMQISRLCDWEITSFADLAPFYLLPCLNVGRVGFAKCDNSHLNAELKSKVIQTMLKNLFYNLRDKLQQGKDVTQSV